MNIKKEIKIKTVSKYLDFVPQAMFQTKHTLEQMHL